MDPANMFMLLVGGFFVCLHVALSTRYIGCEDVYRWLRDGISWISKALPCCLASSDESEIDMVQARVMAEMHFRRLKRMNACFTVFGHMAGFTLASSIWNILAEKQRWMSLYHDVIVCAVSLLFSIFTFRGGITSSTACYVCTVLLMVCCALAVQLAGSSASVVLFTSVITLAPRFVLSMSLMNVPIISLCNAVCCLANYVKISHVTSGSSYYVNVRDAFVYCEIGFLLTVVVVSTEIQKATYSEVVHEVTAKKDSVERSAMDTLLEHVCDVVLTLDERLMISENLNRVAAMLMFDATRFRGSASLQQFMPKASDKQRFEDQFSPRARSTSPVQSINVSMRDACGSSLKVEIFSVPFERVDKQVSYMVGIRELSDVQMAPIQETAHSDINLSATALPFTGGQSMSQWSQGSVAGSMIGLQRSPVRQSL
eukprot:TRINITY_DN30592_c0_g1_i1.p1 TRINITY_DN30592_c0_g1~~TRINITY_DN30592_c0_g1_i1.p1  ORF type:complete len:428 (-),score=50.16 TRINITY_DN30592_c0_g1_i1:86-1369(-)